MTTRAKRAARRTRDWIAAHTPSVVTNYPFEVFVAFVGFVIGTTLLVGLASPTSLALLLPTGIYLAYATALVLGAITVAIGLRKQHALILSSGLQLLGGSYGVYALAVVAVSGATAGVAFILFVGTALVCLIRALHFRRLVDIKKGALNLRRPK